MPVDRVELRLTPFVRLVIPFMGGIISAFYITMAVTLLLASTFAVAALFLFLHNRRSMNRSYKMRWVFGILIFLLLAFAGHGYLKLREKTPLKQVPKEEKTFQGFLIDQPQQTENAIKTLVRIQAMQDTNGVWQEQHGKLLVYMAQDSMAQSLKYGDQLAFQASVTPISNPGNPYSFDYKKYMARRNVHFQSWLDSTKWMLTGEGYGNVFMLYANKLRNRLLDFYRDYAIKGQNFEVAAALTLGFKDYLQDETRQMYASSGAMHILAVSGLHMGIIFLIFQYLFGLIPFPKRLLFMRTLLIITALWMFAVLTGLSPSVLRASVMFSFVVIGKNLRRPTNIYNTLAASAFILLLFNPFLVSYAGFQLSYFAVLAIVYFQPKIYALIYVPNPLLDKVWALIAVSIAAQMGTAPISLYYFHQFPNYFILTNIAVIPLATGILYTAAAAFMLAFLPLAAKLLTTFLKCLLTWLNDAVHIIQSLPGAVSLHVPFHLADAFLLFLALFMLALFLAAREAWQLQAVLAVLIVFFALRIGRSVQDFNKPELHVYNTRDGLLVNIMHGNTSTLLADTIAYQDSQLVSYAANGHLTKEQVHHKTLRPLLPPTSAQTQWRSDVLVASRPFRMLILQQDFNLPANMNFTPDLTILNGYPAKELKPLLSKINPGHIILPASTPWYYRKKAREILQKTNISFHDMEKEGAFQLMGQKNNAGIFNW